MKLRTVAAIPLVVMSLFNLPIGVSPDGIPAVLAWSITLLGVLGLAAAVALIRRRRGAEVVALAVGAVNVVAALIALAADLESAALGLVISAAIVASTLPLVLARYRRAAPLSRP
jgi:MYXO-CTERM domain-containing protein